MSSQATCQRAAKDKTIDPESFYPGLNNCILKSFLRHTPKEHKLQFQSISDVDAQDKRRDTTYE
jgi:hypothetical protein